jgi:hypothetical protein
MLRNTAALALVMLSGCSAQASRPPSGSPALPHIDPYERTDIDELLRFGGDFAKRTAASREDECRWLLRRKQEKPGAGLVLHLVFGRLLSDACGDIPPLLNSLAALPPSAIQDERSKRLTLMQTEALKRLQSAQRPITAAKKRVVIIRKQKSAPCPAAPNQDEARILREKLDAIRSIEKGLDESGAAK